MSKALRRSEVWVRRGLWLVALAFAWFLIGLGGLLISDLPQVERAYVLEDFLDAEQVTPLRNTINEASAQLLVTQRSLDRAKLNAEATSSAYKNAEQEFRNWIATRQATQLAKQDQALIERNQQLDELSKQDAAAQQQIQNLRSALLTDQQRHEVAQTQLNDLRIQARRAMAEAQRWVDLRVFVYRLLLTLPLLLIAAWLFVRKRRSNAWPFVWGFIIFAAFAFFVELVPYLPDFGGYVRYVVGIIVVVMIGHYTTGWLQNYLARQQENEQQPESLRRQEISYDVALARLNKNVCPGCERSVNLKDTSVDYCSHCGIGLFDYCTHCEARKSTFAHFCSSCGESVSSEP